MTKLNKIQFLITFENSTLDQDFKNCIKIGFCGGVTNFAERNILNINLVR
jgi:fluoride ion exporter CrcB/FEX